MTGKVKIQIEPTYVAPRRSMRSDAGLALDGVSVFGIR